jgi:Rrf2 family nitric oxide-sensitive transcriptional repressor
LRGPGGGLELAKAPQCIIIGDVVRCTEGHDVPAACFDGEAPPCCIAPACGLRGVLGEAVAAFYAVLDRHTLADLVQQPRAMSRLLGIDRMARRPGSRTGMPAT